MKSLRVRLTLWFALSFFAATAVFMGLTYSNLDQELRRKSFGTEATTRENWRLRGSLTEEEIREIMNDLVVAGLTFSLPMVLALLLLGWWIARKSLSPIGSLNTQLMAVSTRNLDRRVELAEADEQFRDLVRHLNDMLGRLRTSFGEMSEYAARVAHELRTPLTILRLKVEQSDGRIDPELAEELHGELHRLTHVVDQSLLIAKADQGRLQWDRRAVDIAALLDDLIRDFRLLAAEEKRELRLEQPGGSCWVNVDPRYGKQILHSLLTNSLVHGRGPICIRLRVAGQRVRLTILNQVRHTTPAGHTLGLGLRVVRALVALPGNLGFRQRQGRVWHLSRLELPLEPVQRVAGTGLVPVVAGEHGT
ncbi:MAG: HAMP domain-containing protein [Verrucomicrobia bacterium]|nr:MAG: HAMP domain-containing protein [Verrucomicrobiota bacterium]